MVPIISFAVLRYHTFSELSTVSRQKEQFYKELNSSISRVQDAIAPYLRLMRSEQKKTLAIQEQIKELNAVVASLQSETETL
ncbi:MAG TPA: hypothetical protein VKY19_13490 [Ktedonosporobacter sp.]|nr:hypothetical protein [Ktedonosporobacter sp.]